MFRRFEIEKTIYIHPAFFGLWQESSLFLAKFILQGQLVNHVLRNVGLVVAVPQVLSTHSGAFDPTDGGIYADVRFVCYAFAPVSGTILKGAVSHVDECGVVVSASGLPNIHIPKESMRPGTIYNPEKNAYIWTKIVDGEAKYFEVKHADHIRYQIDNINYSSGSHSIVPYEARSPSPFMVVNGNIRTYSLGPIHWYTATSSDGSPTDAGSWRDVLASLKSDEPDFSSFRMKIAERAQKI